MNLIHNISSYKIEGDAKHKISMIIYIEIKYNGRDSLKYTVW